MTPARYTRCLSTVRLITVYSWHFSVFVSNVSLSPDVTHSRTSEYRLPAINTSSSSSSSPTVSNTLITKSRRQQASKILRSIEMNPSSRVVLVAVASLCVLASVSAAGCKYSVESYTTTDAMIVNEAAFIAQITAAGCEDAPSNLYAEVEGKLVVAANAGPNKYQISWLDDFKKARRGDYAVKLYDENGYGQLRKLLRDGESTSSVTPVHSAYVRYPGAYKGAWVNSEFLAAVVSFVVLYFAYTFKSKIVS